MEIGSIQRTISKISLWRHIKCNVHLFYLKRKYYSYAHTKYLFFFAHFNSRDSIDGMYPVKSRTSVGYEDTICASEDDSLADCTGVGWTFIGALTGDQNAVSHDLFISTCAEQLLISREPFIASTRVPFYGQCLEISVAVESSNNIN